MAAALQARDLVAQQLRIAAIPSVGDQDHDRAAVQRAAPPALMKRPASASPMRVPPDQSLTARDTAAIAASGVGDRNSIVMRVSRVANRKASTSTRAPRQRVREEQQRSRVQLHRSADVAQQHDGPRPRAAPPARQRRDLAAGAKAARERASQIDAAAAPGNPSPGSALARCSRPAWRWRRATMASSSSVSSAKSLSAIRSTIAPRSNARSRPGSSAASTRSAASAWSPAFVGCSRAVASRRLGSAGSMRRDQNTSNSRSKVAMSSCRCDQHRAAGRTALLHASRDRSVAALRRA